VAAPPDAPKEQPPARADAQRRTDLAVRGIIGGAIFVVFAIIMTALKVKGYF
jgi:hypothetical protein